VLYLIYLFLVFSGAIHFTASNNDCGIRNFDMEKFQLSKHFRFPWPVNVSLLDYVFEFQFPIPSLLSSISVYFSSVLTEVVLPICFCINEQFLH
jgi:hypothetical protein